MSLAPLRQFLASRTALLTLIPAIVLGTVISSGVYPLRKVGGSKPWDADSELVDGPLPSVMIRALFVSVDGDYLDVLQGNQGNIVWVRRDAHTGRDLGQVRLTDEWLSPLQFRGAEGTWVGMDFQDQLKLVHDDRTIWSDRLPEQGRSERLLHGSLCSSRNLVAVISAEGSLWLLDFELSEEVACRRFSLGMPLIHTEVSPSGDRVLLITGSRKFLVWDVAQAQVVLQLQAENHCARFGSWSADGRRIITCGDDQEIFVWDVNAGQIVRQLHVDSFAVTVPKLSSDGTLAAVGDVDAIRIWNVETGDELPVLVGHTGKITALQFADQGRTLFSGDSQGGLCRWSLSQQREV